MSYWEPQPGPQAIASVCPCDYTLFGGTRGGGKSDCLLGRQLTGAEQWGASWAGLIVRRKYKQFAEMRRRIDGMIAQGLPCERIGGDQQTNYLRFRNRAQVVLAGVEKAAQLDDFQGHAYGEISIDEGPTFPFFSTLMDKLKGCLRAPTGYTGPCRMFVTGNPGGPGHSQVKSIFIDQAPAGQVFYDDAGESYVYIKSFLRDNRIHCENDPKYARRLQSIKDPALRKAWLDGDWDVFIGQAFEFTRTYHVIDPLPVPKHAQLWFTFDWGFGAPFSVGWWWMDGDGRLYRFAEWYGCGEQPNTGLRIPASGIAEGILEREMQLGISKRKILRLAGHDCFSKQPNFMGGGQGAAVSTIFADYGIILKKGDSSRLQKIQQFRERIRLKRDENDEVIEPPMLLVYKTCKHFIRTIPALCNDEDDPEDVDTEQEDHIYDEACHVCMDRPLAVDNSFRGANAESGAV